MIESSLRIQLCCFAVSVEMWKLVLAAIVVINLGEAQRSSYAPRPGSNSKLLPRFRKNETESGLGTRGGQEDSDSTSTLPPDLQGTLEDHFFVQRVSQWPEDRQPFWFKNRHAISSMRGRDIDGGNVIEQRPRPQFQSSFQSRGGDRPREAARFTDREGFYDYDPLPLYLRRLYG